MHLMVASGGIFRYTIKDSQNPEMAAGPDPPGTSEAVRICQFWIQCARYMSVCVHCVGRRFLRLLIKTKKILGFLSQLSIFRIDIRQKGNYTIPYQERAGEIYKWSKNGM